MSIRKLLIIITIIIAITASFFIINYTGHFVSVGNSKVNAIVARVIDGDTFELITGERVRLIGIDTTEKGEKCYQEAKDRLRELVEGKDIILEKDATDKDRYGRLLRYVYLDDTFINWLLVREGLARMDTIEPNTKYTQEFEQAFLLARNEDGCLWKTS